MKSTTDEKELQLCKQIQDLIKEKEQVMHAETEIKEFVRSDPQRAAAVMTVPVLSPSITRVDDPKYRALVHGAINAISYRMEAQLGPIRMHGRNVWCGDWRGRQR